MWDLIAMVKEYLGKALMRILIIAVIVGAWVGWNWFNAGKTTIDNPTDQAITFTLDGKEYTLQPNSSQNVKLARGEHTLVYNGETTKFEKGKGETTTDDLLGGKYALLNPTKSEYVFYKQIYRSGISESAAYDIVATYDCPTTGDFAAKGEKCPFKFYNDAFIEVVADYGITSDLPERASTRRKGATYVIRSKLFRWADFKKYMTEE